MMAAEDGSMYMGEMEGAYVKIRGNREATYAHRRVENNIVGHMIIIIC